MLILVILGQSCGCKSLSEMYTWQLMLYFYIRQREQTHVIDLLTDNTLACPFKSSLAIKLKKKKCCVLPYLCILSSQGTAGEFPNITQLFAQRGSRPLVGQTLVVVLLLRFAVN